MSDDPDPPGTPVNAVVFDYIKASGFRAVRADGAIGSTTPNGHIHMALYSEREAIPRRTVVALTEQGTLGDVVEVQTRGSIVREMEVDIFLTQEVAESIHAWLGDRIKETKSRGEKQ
ncbi:MAG: hypothetical protein KDA64_05200 [Rhodospirillaceae bacterium]|nr:hypothetical protein [Rhodospirillaceae bacterium]